MLKLIVYNNFPDNKQKFQIIVPDGSVDLYKKTALWKDYEIVGISSINEEQLVTYYVDDEIYFVSHIEAGTPIVPLEAPHRSHWSFSGWSPLPEVMPENASVNIYGEFHQIEYRLQYVSDDKIILDQYCAIDKEIPMAEAPEKDGYYFVKWGRSDSIEGSIMPHHDLVLTAIYEKNGYSLKCYIDGDLYLDVLKSYDEALVLPTPQREHYTFSGWSQDLKRMPDHNVILHGSMIPNKYKISYMVKGRVFIVQKVPYGSKIEPIQIKGVQGYWDGLPEYMVGEDIVVQFKI